MIAAFNNKPDGIIVAGQQMSEIIIEVDGKKYSWRADAQKDEIVEGDGWVGVDLDKGRRDNDFRFMIYKHKGGPSSISIQKFKNAVIGPSQFGGKLDGLKKIFMLPSRPVGIYVPAHTNG